MLNPLKLMLTFAQRSISAALFGILLLLIFALSYGMGTEPYFGLYRYDFLFFFALVVQGLLMYFKLESWQEAKVIALFHVLALIMELVLTAPHIGSWQYPEPAVLKILTVPLFAGFMYSAIGSFFARAIRLFHISFIALPEFKYLMVLALVAYINFMSKFFIFDIRNILFIWSIWLFWRTKAVFWVNRQQFTIPMLVLLLVLASLIWVAENISTFYDIWVYPNQADGWHMVWIGKIGSWYLLLMLSLVFVLKISGQRQSNGIWQLKEQFIKKG
ncbi:DUF817 family protein [Acinetobacter apis]|uniref:DUF817 family protein n=1 Tax=Acinetobacter apis TaxID=1229165 RepID=UPI00389960BC